MIVAYKNGSPIRLRDVGEVIDDVENVRLAGWVDEKAAVIVDIQRQPGANIIQTAERVKALLPRLKSSIPPSVTVGIFSDRTEMIQASIKDVQFTLVLTVVLVVMVIFLFLRKFWATVIPSVALPLAIVGTFGVMQLAGFSLDNLSLMALTIATGFVVGRRDRDDREHRAVHRGGRPADGGGAERRQADRVHDHLAEPFADRRIYSFDLHDGDCGAVVSGIRHHAEHRGGGFRGCVSDPHTDDVRAFADVGKGGKARAVLPLDRGFLPMDAGRVRERLEVGACGISFSR